MAERKEREITRRNWTARGLLLAGMLLITSCGGKEEKAVVVETSASEASSRAESSSVAEQSSEQPAAKLSPISGLALTDEEAQRRIVAVMFDNHYDARWQAGLSEAEIVYEYLMEGNATRYMALFLKNQPEVGPVRSARPYFVDRVMEWDAIYGHFGGSAQALSEISDFDLASIDGLLYDGGVFYRTAHKEAPHNAYTSISAIRQQAAAEGHRTEPTTRSYRFGELKTAPSEKAYEVTLYYSASNVTSYTYSEGTHHYARYKDGELHLDENTNTPLSVANIIVQFCDDEVADQEGHQYIYQYGTGLGLLFRDGYRIPITWSKEERGTLTRYYDESGEEIILAPGQTWIQVIDPESEVNWE